MAGSRLFKAGYNLASTWLQGNTLTRAMSALEDRFSGEEPTVHCAQCVNGQRSCVYCFGHGHTLSTDDAAVPCEPCRGSGHVRCAACRGVGARRQRSTST